MKGEKTIEILEILGGAVIEVGHFVEGFLNAGYGASLSKLTYEIDKAGSKNADHYKESENKKLEQRFYNMLGHLLKDGLVEKEKKDNKFFLKITEKGKNKLQALRKLVKNKLPTPDYSIKKEKNETIILVFDIPEKDKKKRDWLRAVIKDMGFKLLQKSVWLGKGKIPEKFILDLKLIKIVEYVDIFSISKAGSLHKLI